MPTAVPCRGFCGCDGLPACHPTILGGLAMTTTSKHR